MSQLLNYYLQILVILLIIGIFPLLLQGAIFKLSGHAGFLNSLKFKAVVLLLIAAVVSYENKNPGALGFFNEDYAAVLVLASLLFVIYFPIGISNFKKENINYLLMAEAVAFNYLLCCVLVVLSFV